MSKRRKKGLKMSKIGTFQNSQKVRKKPLDFELFV